MKLGIVLQGGSTGVWRFTECLLNKLLSANLIDHATLFTTEHYIPEIHRNAAIWKNRLTVYTLRNKTYTSIRTLRLLHKKAEKLLGIPTSHEINLRAMNQCDVIFYPYPYGINVPEISKPLVFIPHDLTYTRNFGTTVKGPTLTEFLWQRDLHRDWLKSATCVVSSNYVADEIRRVYGQKYNPYVIPLSGLSLIGRLPDLEAQKRLASLGISGRYILCVNNLCPHKNLGQLLGAYHLLRKDYADLKLVLAGAFTDEISGMSDSLYGIQLNLRCDKSDIHGLGIVSDENLVALMQLSQLVVNPSLSEAGNGAGLDAWSLGVPVAMSDIPSFVEHIKQLGVKAELFNPRCIYDIRDAVKRLLFNKNLRESNAAKSLECMQRWTWNQVAEKYANIFRSLNDKHNRGR
jgi:glycosyltransferase involved in cell wall biosynthesis